MFDYSDSLSDMALTPTSEPVTLGALLQVLLLAVAGALQVFNVWNPTQEQLGALVVLYLAIVAVITYVVRRRVSPV